MYLFRIDHNSQYTKFSPWTSHMETSQHDMTSTLNTLASLKMKQWQRRCHLINSVLVRKAMDNFVMSLPLFNPSQIHHPASQLNTPRMHAAFCKMFTTNKENSRCEYTISTYTWCTDINHTTFSCNHSHYTHLPRRDIKIYYNAEANSHLTTTPACSATMANFHLPPHYENSALEVNNSLDMVNLNMINMSSVDFHIWQHLEKHQNKSQLQHLASIPSVPMEQLHRHMVNGIQHITPFTSHEESTGDTDSTWTLFSHTGVLCVGCRIVYTSRIRDL